MPVLDSGAYVSMENVMLLVRALANDMIYSQGGQVLTDTANFTLPLLNDALEWLQNELDNHGVNTFTKETILSTIGPTEAPTDPGTFVSINDQGYFDGVNQQINPQLPPDLLDPIYLWERQTGSQSNWIPMNEVLDGLPSVVPSDRFQIWDWHQDALNMPGAIQTNDIRLRYTGSQAPFVSPTDVLYIRGGTGPIAYKMLAGFLGSRNPEAALVADAEAYKRVSQLATRNARMKQRVTTTRRSYGYRGPRTRYTPSRNS